MKVNTVYIDDDDKELKKYKGKFERDGKASNIFEIVTINSQTEIRGLLNEVESGNPDLILVDFGLDMPKNDVVLGISGGSLSTVLKEKFPEVPIVLFTRRSAFNIKLHPPQLLSSLDGIIYKSDVFGDNAEHLCFLYELAIGFKKLRNVESKNWVGLLELLNAPQNDYDNIKLSNPPLTSGGTWSVSEAANWMNNVLIKYPGILYDPIHSATFLGISLNEFLSSPLQSFFNEARYSGVFKPPEGRWWKTLLQETAESIMDHKELDLLTNEGFPLAWERNNKTSIERSKCVFCEGSPAEWVCYILKKPMMIKYSLFYKPDSRPPVMDEARVSFEAIIISNDVNDNLFDPTGQEMLTKIRKISKK